MKQRVGITLALLYDPQLLIVDKPTLGLDPELWVCFHNLLSDLSDERIVILSMRIAVVNKGKLLRAAAPKNLLKELDSKVRELTIQNNDLVLATWVIRLNLMGKQTEGELSYCFALPSH